MRRLYHHYEKWEDFKSGMWRLESKTEEERLLPLAIEFTGDAKRYGNFMMRVVREWPVSCEQNLTNQGMNRLAWIGHAACSMALHCPEYITRRAWWLLTEQQRDEANAEAQAALDVWVYNHHRHAFGQGVLL